MGIVRPGRIQLSRLLEPLAAQIRHPGHESFADVSFSHVCTDTRALKAGDFFVALSGPNFDGHDYLAQAQRDGAVAAMVSRVNDDLAFPQLLVDDTLLALGQLAAWWRQQHGIPVVAVTGSNGKTTVKEMLASILRQQHRVLVTQGNLNNDIGVPLTLLGMNAGHEYAVVEMGASKAGDIDYLTHLAQPDVALITNVAPAHLEGFGDIAGVARAKGEIFSGLGVDGVAVLNADEARVGIWRVMTAGRRVISFGLRNEVDVTAVALNGEAQTGCSFKLCTPIGQVDVALALVGRHNVMNALAASSAAMALEIPLSDIKVGLESMRPVNGRLAPALGIFGVRLINDTYNANPGSIRAALDVLVACTGETVLVLGDMGELGNAAAALHEQVGRQARTSGIKRLYTVGDFAGLAAGTFGVNGHHFSDQAALIVALKNDLADCQLKGSCTVLVKGSRSMHMERVVEALAINGEAPGAGQDSVKQARVEA